MTIKIEIIKYVNDILKIIFIYIHTSKKIHNAKKMLILMFLTLLILPLLILGYKSRKQCILIEKKNKLKKWVKHVGITILLSQYRSIVLLLFLFLLLCFFFFFFFFVFFFCIPLHVSSFTFESCSF